MKDNSLPATKLKKRRVGIDYDAVPASLDDSVIKPGHRWHRGTRKWTSALTRGSQYRPKNIGSPCSSVHVEGDDLLYR